MKAELPRTVILLNVVIGVVLDKIQLQIVLGLNAYVNIKPHKCKTKGKKQKASKTVLI